MKFTLCVQMCIAKILLMVPAASAKADGKKMATESNHILLYPGALCDAFPPQAAVMCIPGGSSVTSPGQDPTKVDGSKSLGSGAKWSCPLWGGSPSVTDENQKKVHHGGASANSADPFSAVMQASGAGAGATDGGDKEKKPDEKEKDEQGDPQSIAPSGRKGQEMENSPYQKTRHQRTEIEDREYSGYALDQMQNRGIPPSAYENTIARGTPKTHVIDGKTTTNYYDSSNNITVVVNDKGSVVTV